MIAVMIRIPTSWLGANGIRSEAFRTRLSESDSRLTHEKLLEWWEAKDSTLRMHDIRARRIAEKEGLEIMVPDAEYRHLETVGAAILRSAEDLLVAMAGTLEETFATWEKVEAAKNLAVLPGRSDGRKPAMVTERRCDPILPGDKVVFVDSEIPREIEVQFTSRPWCGYWEKQEGELKRGPTLQSVRKISVDPITGEQMVHLVGCYGVSSTSKQEPGFPARFFRKVSESRGVVQLSEGDLFQVPVETSARIARQLEGFPLLPQVDEIHEWITEEQFEVVCRRWVNRRHQSKPIRDARAAVREEIAEDGAVTLQVPLSALGWQNLAPVCQRLDITPVDWLQGVLHNLAVRVTKMRTTHEVALRKAQKGVG